MKINGLKLRGKNIDVSVDGEKFHVTVNVKARHPRFDVISTGFAPETPLRVSDERTCLYALETRRS